jgi:Zierdtviridae exonuclease
MATAELPIVTTSERRAFKRCPQQWWWAYRKGLSSKLVNDKYWFGIGIHLALEKFYGKGSRRYPKGMLDVWEDFCDNDDMSRVLRTRPDGTEDTERWLAARELGVGMLNGYMGHYGKDRDLDFIYTERPFQIRIPHPTRKGDDIALFMSTFDGVYRDKDGRCWLIEHKTAASITTGHLAMDDQGGIYWAVATQVLRAEGVLGPKEVIHGVMYNFLRKAVPNDERAKDKFGYYLNKDGSRSKNQPPPFFHREPIVRTQRQRINQIKSLAHEVAVMDRFRSGELEVYKTPTRDCNWDCSFYNMCELHSLGSNWQDFGDAMFVQVDPYDRYRNRKAA